VRWRARPAPGPLDLALGELRRGVGGGLAALRAARDAVAHPLDAALGLAGGVQSLGEAFGSALTRASATSLNVEIGPHRRFDWLRFELAAVKEVKNRLGGTVNDVVLATVTSALRRFLRKRGEDVDHLDFRAMIPVNIRNPDEAGRGGNRVSMVAARLPLEVHDSRKRLQRVIDTTRAIKASRQAQGVEVLEEVSELGLTALFARLARLTALTRPFNVVVTNVPGPQFPVYLLGAQMLAAYPLVPLYRNQTLGIALFSYDGGLYWGLNADWDRVPDLHELAELLALEFEALRKASPPRRADA
jgi:WS/DGAT/MGAT family acyltransferase